MIPNADILRSLTRAKAEFQLRAVTAAMGFNRNGEPMGWHREYEQWLDERARKGEPV